MTAAWLAAALLSQTLPPFKGQLVDDKLDDLWACAVADVNADGKPDLIALSWKPASVVWYENPGWKKRVLVAQEPQELVAIQPFGAGFALGADYHEPPDPKKGGGTIWLLRRPEDLEKPWKPFKIAEAPTLHRIHAIDRKDLVCSALHGPTFVLRAPDWTRETVAESLTACHNTLSIDWDGDGTDEILTASREGLTLHRRRDGAWTGEVLAKGAPGASEVAVGRLPGGRRYLATIEPHHGAEFCVYTEKDGAPSTPLGARWNRRVLLVNKGGHTLIAADLTKTGVDSLLVGFVGRYSKAPGGPIWHLFHPLDAAGEKWEDAVLDDTKLPGEDGAVADLDGDGRLDCVLAGGSRLKIYWNTLR
jgi:hypothetical protein